LRRRKGFFAIRFAEGTEGTEILKEEKKVSRGGAKSQSKGLRGEGSFK